MHYIIKIMYIVPRLGRASSFNPTVRQVFVKMTPPPLFLIKFLNMLFL